MKYLPFVLLVALIAACEPQAEATTPQPLQTGADRLVEDEFSLLEGRNVGVITNHTAVTGGRHIVDVMHEAENVNVVALFGPEHGIRGDDVGAIDDDVDEKTGLPVHSLYGEIRAPTSEMLEDVDVLVFDIQDIGPRFYTYISTMGLAMQTAAEHDISFVVLDRPNPIGGELVEGFVREEEYESFVGFYPIPVTHGLTIGELATMAKEENMVEGIEDLDLHVVELEDWERSTLWSETDRDWPRPSPNIPDFETALIYPGACFFEGTTASEGRGTQEPFILLGAPWADGEELAETLNGYELPGLQFEPATFTPESIEGMAPNPKWEGEELEGIRYVITDPHAVRPVEAGVYVLHTFYHQAPEEEQDDFFRRDRLNRLAGTSRLHDMLVDGASPEEVVSAWQSEVEEFDSLRRNYFLYD